MSRPSNNGGSREETLLEGEVDEEGDLWEEEEE